MIAAFVRAIESPPAEAVRILEVPQIRLAGELEKRGRI
jgi:hypothetical protein